MLAWLAVSLRLDVSGRARSNVSFRGLVPSIGALASLLVAMLYSGISLTTLALVALVPVFELLALPDGRSQRRQTATFVLIVVAATVDGWLVALALGLLAMAVEEWQSPSEGDRILAVRSLMLAALIGAGAITSALSWPATPMMLLWILAIGLWLLDRTRQGQTRAVMPMIFALTWLGGLLGTTFWLPSVPFGTHEFVGNAIAGLGFAVGFMTVDSLVGSLLAWQRSGLTGLHFWRSELMPTFARYNLMAAYGAALGALFLAPGRVGVIIAFTGLVLLLSILIVRLDRERAHRRLVATVCALSSALDARDPYTRGHSDRVAAYAVGIAKHLGWTSRRLRDLELAAHLHDVGKIGVPDAILNKPGKLTQGELAVIQTHAEQSASIVRNVPELRQVAEVIWQHHERLDGSGYPRGLTGNEISPTARVLGVADSFDAMTSNRAYRSAMPIDEAVRRIAAERETKYDSLIVDSLRQLVAEERIEGVLVYTYCLSH